MIDVQARVSSKQSSPKVSLKELANLLKCEQAAGVLETFMSEYGLDETSATKLFRYHGVTGLLASKFRDPLPAFLKTERSLLVATEALRKRQLESLFSALKKARINEYVVFKGGALAYTLYSDPWQRPRTDIDILVDEDSLEALGNALHTLGFRRLCAISGSLISYQHSFAKQLAGDASLMIDVHWKISNRQCLANAVELSRLIRHSEQLPSFATPVRIPNTEYCLLVACLHRLGHHHDEERLAWLYDIHLLMQKMDDTEWAFFVELAIKAQCASICLNGIMVAHELFGASSPPSVLKQLQISAQRPEPSQFLLEENVSNRALFINDLRALDGLKNKLVFIYQTAFPPIDYLKQRMQTESVPKAFVMRAIGGVGKLLRN